MVLPEQPRSLSVLPGDEDWILLDRPLTLTDNRYRLKPRQMVDITNIESSMPYVQCSLVHYYLPSRTRVLEVDLLHRAHFF